MLVLTLMILLTAVALPSVTINSTLYMRTVSLVLLVSASLSYNLIYTLNIGNGMSLFSGLYEVTMLTQTADTFIFLMGALAILPWAPLLAYNDTLTKIKPYGITYIGPVWHQLVFYANQYTIKSQRASIPEYALLVLFSTIGASLLVSSSDLVSMYLSIELQSFGVYILATLYRDSYDATDSGLKYFLLGGLSSCFILLGSAILYTYTGTTSLEGIYTILSVATGDSITSGLGATSLAFTIMVCGYLFKIASAPFHNWAPDVYDGVPTIVTTWLATMPKLSILVFLLGVSAGININLIETAELFSRWDAWEETLLIASLLSLVTGTVVGLAQPRIKRLLAYSTISHVGFMLLALAINSELGVESFILYIGQYTLTSINAFMVLLALGYSMNITRQDIFSNSGDITLISRLAGQAELHPLLALSFAASLFSMAGVPPMIGFFGKQSVLLAAMSTQHYFMAIVGVVVSVISASYYLKVIRVLHFDSLPAGSSLSPTVAIGPVHAFMISLLTLTLSLFIFNPNLVLDSITVLALTVFNS